MPLSQANNSGAKAARVHEEYNVLGSSVTIKTADLSDMQLLMDWATREGWNPGLEDHELFFQSDPGGFLMAFDKTVPVAGISVVRTDKQFGFLGLYICPPQYRGLGYGWAVWQAGMQHLDDRIVGLDGVVEQQANYAKSGFESLYRNIRYAGSTTKLKRDAAANELETGMRCRPVSQSDREAIIRLDAKVHAHRREQMLDSWICKTKTRFSLVCLVDDCIEGFATIRQCHEGYKVGPLIGLSPQIAQALLIELVRESEADQIVLDVPEPNQAAVSLAEKYGLSPVFETARMVKGGRPEYWLDGLFGVTSFELG
ncbi:GNAT family N-acetyltransferase [Granulosicoccus antarcticus]|uniref:N-acetyltransferase domain-containing protein n=1 Tax=Granulosicoccus antarcticus IMCC3135 TaxID=1192854 RepID=A0A2Z2NW70_9GAMM|nr:GNAT family N-acetyltransferase [Granulosicoccus antarcticus]ASJ75706.1 hypothetical protein IMCC3135_28270 [Granulosicoccus antarcticus IMCC3135]